MLGIFPLFIQKTFYWKKRILIRGVLDSFPHQVGCKISEMMKRYYYIKNLDSAGNRVIEAPWGDRFTNSQTIFWTFTKSRTGEEWQVSRFQVRYFVNLRIKNVSIFTNSQKIFLLVTNNWQRFQELANSFLHKFTTEKTDSCLHTWLVGEGACQTLYHSLSKSHFLMLQLRKPICHIYSRQTDTIWLTNFRNQFKKFHQTSEKRSL